MSIESPFLGECITYFIIRLKEGYVNYNERNLLSLSSHFVWHFYCSVHTLLFGGDTDLDVDLDGELDMDVSDIVSFKGLVHFVMGASGWLCIKQSISHSVEWYDYLIALVCGILFVVILYYLYKLCLKLQHQVIPEEGEALVGRVGFISIPNDLPNSHSILLIEINGMLQELPADFGSESPGSNPGSPTKYSFARET